MKASMMMAVAAASLAFLAAGCRYSKPAGDANAADANASDISGAGAAGAGANVSSIPANPGPDVNAQEGSLSNLGEQRFEDMFGRCTDVSFDPVYFGFDSTVVPSSELGKIDAVAQHLQAKPERVVVVEGHCDERGANEYNLSLGENRAEIIRNYLVQNGIAAQRIQTRSYGEEKPAVEGHDESAWCKNRRGEFGIYDTRVRK